MNGRSCGFRESKSFYVGLVADRLNHFDFPLVLPLKEYFFLHWLVSHRFWHCAHSPTFSRDISCAFLVIFHVLFLVYFLVILLLLFIVSYLFSWYFLYFFMIFPVLFLILFLVIFLVLFLSVNGGLVCAGISPGVGPLNKL